MPFNHYRLGVLRRLVIKELLESLERMVIPSSCYAKTAAKDEGDKLT